MSPVSAIATLLGIALGVWGGFWVMDRVSPDLPDPDTEAAVETPAEVDGGDAGSLLRPGPFATALDQLSGQLAAGDAIVSLELRPSALDAETGSGGLGLEPDEIPPDAPQRIIDAFAAERENVGLDDVNFMLLREGNGGPEWYVQLKPDVDPPRAFTATVTDEGVLLNVSPGQG